MNQKIRDIADRIRELREVCGYSREQLASELGIPLEVYTSYEEVGENIPISTIYEIANKFRVDFNEIITGEPARLNTYHLVRRGTGKIINRYPGYNFKDLAYRYSDKIMQPLLVTIDPSDEPAALVTHSGQEFNYVLEGTIVVTFAGKDLVLQAGDCLYFNPTYPHGQKAIGDKPATFVTIIAE